VALRKFKRQYQPLIVDVPQEAHSPLADHLAVAQAQLALAELKTFPGC